MVINMQMIISWLKHGCKPKNENQMFKTWL